MDEKFERMMKNKSSMTDVRIITKRFPEFQQQFKGSMTPVLAELMKRFESMSLKDVPCHILMQDWVG